MARTLNCSLADVYYSLTLEAHTDILILSLLFFLLSLRH